MSKSSSVKLRTIFVGKKCCAWLRSVFKPKAAINCLFIRAIITQICKTALLLTVHRHSSVSLDFFFFFFFYFNSSLVINYTAFEQWAEDTNHRLLPKDSHKHMFSIKSYLRTARGNLLCYLDKRDRFGVLHYSLSALKDVYIIGIAFVWLYRLLGEKFFLLIDSCSERIFHPILSNFQYLQRLMLFFKLI